MQDTTSFTSELQDKRELINAALRGVLSGRHQVDGRLKEAISYTLQGQGKRLRGAVVLWSCQIAGGRVNSNAQAAAAAVEMVHTYSLVHDDLPAMDNDDMRRGAPTCHKVFDEAVAVLVGDALLTMAFEVLARDVDDSSLAVELIKELSSAAGPAGMIAGQMADLDAEKRFNGHVADPDRAMSAVQNGRLLESIHMNKTAKMFGGAAAMGALCGGATPRQLSHLRKYGLLIGLGFQIADDILDVSATSNQLGKTAGKDAAAGKLTYPALFGIVQSRQKAQSISAEAVESLEIFGQEAGILRALALALLDRER